MRYLAEVAVDRLPADLRIRKNLAEARYLAGSGEGEGARLLIDDAARAASGREELGRLFEGLVALYGLRAHADGPGGRALRLPAMPGGRLRRLGAPTNSEKAPSAEAG